MSAVAAFQQELGREISKNLGGSYKFLKSRQELRAEVPDGHNVLILSAAAKYSPYVELAFYFGRNFNAAKRIEKIIGGHAFPYHIQQFSMNHRLLSPLPFSGPHIWSIDINNPPRNLAAEVTNAIIGIAVPFFERYADIRTARDAIANNDPWCFSGNFLWSQVLLLDLALDDLAHFDSWSQRLDPFSKQQAREKIEKYNSFHR